MDNGELLFFVAEAYLTSHTRRDLPAPEMTEEDAAARVPEGLTLLSMALLYLAMKDSEMMFIMGGALAASYAAALLIAGQRKKALLYALTVFPASILFALTKTNFIDIALHPASYVDGSGAEAWMTEKLLSVNRGRLVALFFKYLAWLSDLLFGSWYVLCSFLVLVLILLEVRFLGKKKTAPREKGAAAGFIWVIAAVCGIYYVFAMLVAIPAERYFMFYTPLLAILLWKLLHELTAGLPTRRALLLGCLVLTGLGLGIFVSSVTTRYRDLSFVVEFGVSLWMYASPVVYPLSQLRPEGPLYALMRLNPMTFPLESFRLLLLGQGTILWSSALSAAVFTALALIGGMLIFNRVEQSFTDTV